MRISLWGAVLAASLLPAALVGGGSAESTEHGVSHAAQQAQPYGGEDGRQVASLSEEELIGYREGRGLGLARPAELNGYPGPMHVLDLASELGLSPEQRLAFEAIKARMRQAAQAAGARYLEAERAVNDAFRTGETARIESLVRHADAARAEVRLTHLRAHIETATLLTPEQRRRYAELRGYGAAHHGGHRH
jgi:Spy/CpxP family protein refolding chaperone